MATRQPPEETVHEADRTCQTKLRVEALEDDDPTGFDPAGPYIDCWLPLVGPSSAWLYRKLAGALGDSSAGAVVSLEDLASELGLGRRLGANGPMRKSLERLVRFGLARWGDDATYRIRRRLPPLAESQLRRLSTKLGALHHELSGRQQTPQNALLSAALSYAARGLSVLPLRPSQKVPDGSLAPSGLLDATTDPVRIRIWWRASPSANVGIRTGAGLDVIDIDSDAGRAVLARCAPEVFRDAVGVATSSGLHLWFASSGLRSRARVLDGVDVRAEGGYVVAPPSVHPSGARYRFVDMRSDKSLEGLPAEALSGVPESFKRLCDRPRPEFPSEPLSIRSGIRAYARRALEDECAQVAQTAEGSRNDRLNRAAFAIGTLVGAGALDQEAARDTLYSAALCAGLAEREAKRTIESGICAGILRPRHVKADADTTESRAARSAQTDCVEEATRLVVARARSAGHPVADRYGPSVEPDLSPGIEL